jgi:hypothetical protein
LNGLYVELCGDDFCINLFCDIQSDIYLTKDKMFHERTMHTDVKYHYVCDIVAEGNKVSVSKFEWLLAPASVSFIVQEIVEVHATKWNLSQGGVCYIVIQILKKANF